MKRAAVSQLKSRLSRFLAGVKQGQEVLVTERGRLIAKLIPFSAPEDDEQRRLQEMERQGLIRLGRGKLPANFWRLPRPEDPEGTVLQALIEERRGGR